MYFGPDSRHFFVTDVLEITNYGWGRRRSKPACERPMRILVITLSFNRVRPIRDTSGKSPFIHFRF